MASRFKRPTTPAERARRERAHADKLTALHARLTEQVAALRSGEDWRRWLDVASRFHSYSFNNTLLIWAQRPDATLVAGYSAWQALGRQVDKGEKGVQILAPVVRRGVGDGSAPRAVEGGNADAGDATATVTGPSPAGLPTPPRAEPAAGTAPAGPDDDETGRGRRVAGFRVTYVWDVSQTSGDPLPERPRPQLLAGQAPEGLWDSLTELLDARGFTVERGDCTEVGRASPTANGWTDFATRTVRVRDDVDDAHAVKTLAHEVGHVLLHEPDTAASPAGQAVPGADITAWCRGAVEVEAESVAYLIAGAHGMDTSGYTFAYVTSWAADVNADQPEQVVRDTGQRVLTAARAVLEATVPAEPVDPELAARAQTGAQRAAAALERAAVTETRADAHTAAAAPNPSQQSDRWSLLFLHDAAADYYRAALLNPAAAGPRGYLQGRGLGHVLAEHDPWKVGYAPPGWTNLVEHLRGRGYSDAQILDAGLGMRTSRGTVVDRFRDRIMLPVREHDSRHVIAFIGRALPGPGRDVPPDVPKYLNSPDTPLYRKGELLYGLAEQRAALAAGGRPVLVEGPLDVLAVTAAHTSAESLSDRLFAPVGVRLPAVAPSGTALTPAQVAALATLADPAAGVTVAFDNDAGGRPAAARAHGLLTGTWADSALAQLPAGADPADLLEHKGPHALLAALERTVPLADAAVDAQLEQLRPGDHVTSRVMAMRAVAPLVAALPVDQVARQAGRLAARLDLAPATVTAEIAEAVTRAAAAPARLAERDRRLDLDRGQSVAASHPPQHPRNAAALAGVGYPASPRAAVPRSFQPAGAPAPATAGCPAATQEPAVTSRHR